MLCLLVQGQASAVFDLSTQVGTSTAMVIEAIAIGITGLSIRSCSSIA